MGGVITIIGNVAGFSINPARAFGPYLAGYILGGSNLWANYPIYMIGLIVGAVIGGPALRLLGI